MWRRVFNIGGGGHLEPLCVEHAGLMARLLDDFEGAHWTAIARPDPDDPVPWVLTRLSKTPACYVVFQGEQPVGYAQLRLEEDVGSPALWLTPSLRQRGHGSRVIRGLAGLAERARLNALVTGIRHGNVASCAAFQRCGWARTDWRVGAPFSDCGIWALAVNGAASRSALNLAALRFYRASAPLLGLHLHAAVP
ncbi:MULTISPECIES: GNAT family N-acetyltransferase [unclassified Hydrogenophaga]|uniref:GNAT family N-acetyltransferase n=1 Tax=unclassified Hydrogenophaga TaxID=2610897 RepID=UPI0009E8D74F|nr:GNAT family N-acetyltransferase [Hydrogenophaga sp. Root209]